MNWARVAVFSHVAFVNIQLKCFPNMKVKIFSQQKLFILWNKLKTQLAKMNSWSISAVGVAKFWTAKETDPKRGSTITLPLLLQWSPTQGAEITPGVLNAPSLCTRWRESIFWSTETAKSAKNLYHLPYPFLEIIFSKEKINKKRLVWKKAKPLLMKKNYHLVLNSLFLRRREMMLL